VSFVTLLPMAFVMIAGPQILSSIFLATSDDWRGNSIAFLAGAATSITVVVTAAYFLIHGATGGEESDTVYYIVLALLAAAMVHAFVKRKVSEPPKWMGKLETANRGFSFKLGFLLLGVFPSDLLTSAAVGAYLGNHQDPWWHVLPFVALTIILLGLPLILMLVFRKRATALMPKARQWMNDNSWIVNELVLLLFVAITLNSLSG
jgi:hypothetical protein